MSSHTFTTAHHLPQGNARPDNTWSQTERNAYANRHNPNHPSYQGNQWRNASNSAQPPRQHNRNPPNQNNRAQTEQRQQNGTGNQNNSANNGRNRNNPGNGNGGKNPYGGNRNHGGTYGNARNGARDRGPDGFDVLVRGVELVCDFITWYRGPPNRRH